MILVACMTFLEKWHSRAFTYLEEVTSILNRMQNRDQQVEILEVVADARADTANSMRICSENQRHKALAHSQPPIATKRP